MNALRIRRMFKAPIPELPELTPFVGKTVEIIVLDEGEARVSGYEFGEEKVVSESDDDTRGRLVASLDELKGEGIGDALDGFEETVERWRAEPWMGPEK